MNYMICYQRKELHAGLEEQNRGVARHGLLAKTAHEHAREWAWKTDVALTASKIVVQMIY